MGRTISGTLSGILSAAARDIDWTCDLIFPSQTMRFATSPIVVSGNSYTNELQRVSAIRQTIEAPTDTVSVGIQNLNRTLGQHVAANWAAWRSAIAIIGRNYYQTGSNGVRTGTSTWVEMFRGAVQRPTVDDFEVAFDIVPDTVSPGQIVADRNLGPLCPALFKQSNTCGYSGGLTTCNHLLRSPDGCDGRSNSHRFMGFEHRYAPDVNVPGTGGNDDPLDDGSGINPDCPRVDQYVRVRGENGDVEPQMVAFLTLESQLWNPRLRRFVPIKSLRHVPCVPIWELLTVSGAVGYSSGSHPIIADFADMNGRPVETIKPRERVLAEHEDLLQTSAALLRQFGTGDVMHIEIDADTDEEKIYCYGDTPQKMIVCHNRKDEPILI